MSMARRVELVVPALPQETSSMFSGEVAVRGPS
jgi:hypothetical protein